MSKQTSQAGYIIAAMRLLLALSGNYPGSRVNQDNLPAYFPSVVHRCTGAAAPRPIVNSQQEVSVFQKAVAFQHTVFVVVPADIDDRISLLQDRVVKISR